MQPLPDSTAQVLAVICVGPQQMIDRRRLAETIFGASENRRINLRKRLSRMDLPRVGDEHTLDEKANTLLLNHNIAQVDAVDVLASQNIDTARARSLLEELDGIFLDGQQNGSEEFEIWLRETRQRLRECILTLSEKAAEHRTRYGLFENSSFSEIADRLVALGIETETIRQVLAPYRKRLNSARPARPGTKPSPLNPALPEVAIPRVALLRPQLNSPSIFPVDQFVADVANRLSRFRSFAVIAPYSSFAVETKGNPDQGLSQLRADYCVLSSYAGEQDQAVLTASLVNVKDQTIVWSQELSVNLSSMSISNQRMAQTLANTLAETLEMEFARQERTTGRGSAYLNYLLGRKHLAKGDLPNLRRARAYFGEALGRDKGFSLALARIAETFIVEWLLRGGNDGELLANARIRAEEACDADPGSANALWVLGSAKLYQRDYDHILTHFDQARALAPNSADLLLDFADAQTHLDDPIRANETFLRALDLNPTPPDRYWWFGASIALACGNYADAAQRCDLIKADEIGVGVRTAAYALNGERRKAAHWASRLQEILPNMTADELCELAPGDPGREQKKHYREGLRAAGID